MTDAGAELFERLMTMADEARSAAYDKNGRERRGKKAAKAYHDYDALYWAILRLRPRGDYERNA